MIKWHWFSKWLVPCHHMSSLGHSELIYDAPIFVVFALIWNFQYSVACLLVEQIYQKQNRINLILLFSGLVKLNKPHHGAHKIIKKWVYQWNTTAKLPFSATAQAFVAQWLCIMYLIATVSRQQFWAHEYNLFFYFLSKLFENDAISDKLSLIIYSITHAISQQRWQI